MYYSVQISMSNTNTLPIFYIQIQFKYIAIFEILFKYDFSIIVQVYHSRLNFVFGLIDCFAVVKCFNELSKLTCIKKCFKFHFLGQFI